MAAVPEAQATGAERQRRLVGILACPQCHDGLEFDRATEAVGAIVDADLRCDACGEVGVIRSYRPSFHPTDLGDAWAPAGLAERALDLPDGMDAAGDWHELPNGVLGLSIGSCLTGITEAPGVVVELGMHDWGAAALVSLGDREERVELRADAPIARRIVLQDLERAGQPRRWSIVVVPGAAHQTDRTQAIVRSVAELVPAGLATSPSHTPRNLGNPYPPRFAALLADCRPDAMVLDVGGGDRRHTDWRVLNFEYMKFPNADFFGDGLHLPIASDSVDLIMSQAVLEHVPEPQRAVDELYRILRPGGRLYAEFAFMQPLHAVPYHYFNITPHGAALLFDKWTVHATGVFGGLHPTLSWFFQLLGAEAKLGKPRAESVLAAMAELDAQLSGDELEYVASAVYVEATKPNG